MGGAITDWKTIGSNVLTGGMSNIYNTKEAIDTQKEDLQAEIDAAKEEANKPRTTTLGTSASVGSTGVSAGKNISSLENYKKKKLRAGTTSAQIPTTGITTSTGVGLGGV